MGMAASQARLLCITARIHDVEFQAQSIQNAKMSLSKMSNAAMQEWLEAQDANVLTISTMNSAGEIQKVVATYNNLMSKDRLTGSSGQKYAIRNENELLVVPDDVYQAYQDFMSCRLDKTADNFAKVMLKGGEDFDEDDIRDAEVDTKDPLYKYYFEIFQQIQQCGGCVSIDSYDGSETGDAANNSEWLTNMINSGKFTIDLVEIDKKTGELTLTGTSTSSDSALKNSKAAEIDERALAIADAKYEHTLRQIDAKDKEYDMQLSKLDTERSTLDKQFESLKKVIGDNIERSFGIFS